jgi:hypothetical protein
MFRLDFRVIRPGCAAHLAGNSGGGFPIGKIPTETYVVVMRKICYQHKETVPYMQSAFSESVVITRSLSSSRHLRILLSE